MSPRKPTRKPPGKRDRSSSPTGKASPAERAPAAPPAPPVAQLVTRHCHEVRQPLLGIRGYAEMMAESPSDGELVREGTRQILAQADRLTRLVDDLALTLSQPGARRRREGLPPERRLATPLAPPLTAAVGLFRYRLSESVRVLVELPHDLPGVDMPPEALERIAINLLANALDALPARGLVQIRARVAPDERAVIIEFADDGQGVGPDLRQHLFEPYHTTKARGTGLGLAICRDLAERAGGSLVLCPCEDIGPPWRAPVRTVFRLTLPRA